MQAIGYEGLMRNAGSRAAMETPERKRFDGILTHDWVDCYIAARKIPDGSTVEITYNHGPRPCRRRYVARLPRP